MQRVTIQEQADYQEAGFWGWTCIALETRGKLDVINFTNNHVLAKVVEDDGFKWYLTGFYGWLEAS